MTTYTIDTAAAIRRMTAAGIAEDHAAAIVETFAESNEALATKADIDVATAKLMRWIVAMPVATAAAAFVLERLFA